MGLRIVKDDYGADRLLLFCDKCHEQLDIISNDNFVMWKDDKPYFVHGGKCANKLDRKNDMRWSRLKERWNDSNCQRIAGPYKRPK
jgi:hypothetical protein